MNSKTIIIVFAVAAILLFAGLGASPIYILDEARNAQCAREMMERNDWVVPTFNGELRGQKPPLHYYFMWASYKIFGVNAFAARFFSAVMGLLTLLITWRFTKRFLGTGAALWTVMVLAASTHFLFEFRLAVPDPYLIFFITAGIFCFYSYVYVERSSLLYLVLSAVALGLAVLAKGPVALALPGAAIGLWLLLSKKWKVIVHWYNLLFLAIVTVLSLPWFIKVHQLSNGAFTESFFLVHNLHRFEEPMEGHGGLFVLVPLFILIGLLPLSVFIVEPVKKWRLYKSNPLLLLAAAVVLVFILVFSVSGTKLPNYPMPCYPFAAVLIGYWINQVLEERRAVKRYPFIILFVITLLLSAGAVVGLHFEPAMTGREWWAIAFVVLPVTAAIAWIQFKKGLHRSLITVAAGYAVFNFLFLVIIYNAVYRMNPVAQSLPYIDTAQPVVAYKIYNEALNFSWPRTIPVAENIDVLREKIQANPNAVVITRESLLPELQELSLQVITRHRDLFETPTTILLQKKNGREIQVKR